MKAKLHVLARAALAGSLLAPLPWSATSMARAESPPGGARVRSLPYHTPPSGHKAPLLGRLIGLQSQPRSAEQPQQPVQQQPAQQRSSSGGVTLERLWDRWQGRRGAPQSEASRTQQPQSPSPNQPAESQALPLESPQPIRPEGEFPAFRSDIHSSPAPVSAAQSPPPLAVQPSPLRPAVRSAAEPSRPAADSVIAQPLQPAVENRTIRARPIEPAPQESSPPAARITVRTTEPPKPIAAPARSVPRRSTSAYLADEVRYGEVIRRTSSASIDPTRGILGEANPSEAAQPARPTMKAAAKQPVARSAEASPSNGSDAVANLDAVFSRESAVVPQLLPLGAEDLCSMASVLPAPSAQFHGVQQIDGERVSASASPAMLQHALRNYGMPGGQETPPLKRIPAVEPVLEQPIPAANSEASQRSVLLGGDKPLGFHRENHANSQNRGHSSPGHRMLQGSVAGVDQEHGTILVQFPGNRLPPIGSKVQVYQKVLIKRDLLGEFRVVGVQGNAVVAEPLGRIDLELILNGDEATAI